MTLNKFGGRDVCVSGTITCGNGIYTKDDKSTYYIFENANPYIFDDCFEYLRSSRVYCEDKFVDCLTEYRLIFEDDAFLIQMIKLYQMQYIMFM